MPHEYTRQRQGRDFTLHEALMRALDESRRNDETARNAEVTRKTLAKRLKQCKGEAERNAVPVDGHEPSEKGRY
jgi:hypothetical protein